MNKNICEMCLRKELKKPKFKHLLYVGVEEDNQDTEFAKLAKRIRKVGKNIRDVIRHGDILGEHIHCDMCKLYPDSDLYNGTFIYYELDEIGLFEHCRCVRYWTDERGNSYHEEIFPEYDVIDRKCVNDYFMFNVFVEVPPTCPYLLEHIFGND